MNDEGEQGINVVIFEGGLAGGLSSLILFKQLWDRVYESRRNSEIRNQFEVIAGTGTGALAACMLGLLGLTIDRAILAYTQLVQHVFSEKKLFSKSGSGVFKAIKLEEALKRMTRDVTGNENRLLSELGGQEGSKVMTFAMSEHNITASRPRIFRSYRRPSNQMPDCPMWQAVRASMAHPELFKSVQVGDGLVSETLVGGDVGCSNPTPYVLAEVREMYPNRHISSIICIGAGHARTIQIPKPSPLHRIMPTNVLVAMKEVATDSERVAQDMAARFEDTANVYFRFQVDQGMQEVRISHWQSCGEVIAHTRTYVQKEEVARRLRAAAQAVANKKATLNVTHISGRVQQSLIQQRISVKRCPVPSPVFTGCDRTISMVSRCLSGPANERRVCVVYGLGGCGKTQIALKAIERTLDKRTDIAYIDASSQETTESNLKDFALARKIGETCNDTILWLESVNQPWLLVFDNADDPKLGLSMYMPKCSHGSVLVTTRLRNLALLGQGPGSDCDVGGMGPDEAVELLLKKARRQDETISREENEEAFGLVQDLGYLALAIVHAGAYIWCSESSIARYRRQCQENTQNALEQYSRLPASIDQREKTVYTTWAMSYESLSPRTQKLLWHIAYLHNDMIKEEIFRRATTNMDRRLIITPGIEDQADWQYVHDYLRLLLNEDGRWDSSAFSAMMNELLSYSLVEYDRANETYAFHVLVQDWIRTMIPYSSTTARRHASHLLALSIDCSTDTNTHAYRRGLLVHVGRVLDNLGAIDANDAAYFAKVYEENGLWEEEERQWVRVVDARKQQLGENDPETLTSMSHLASAIQKQGRWADAEALQMRVLNARREVLGELHPDTLSSMDSLGSIYLDQGRSGEAETLQIQILDIRKRLHRERHPNILASMNNLASTYLKQGRWGEAEELQVQVVEARKQELGEDHPETLTSMDNLGSTYVGQGRWNEAETLQARVLDFRRRVHCENHPNILCSMRHLALIYWKKGRCNEAEKLELHVLDATKRVHGEQHPETLAIMNNLASTYQTQGRWAEAESLETQILYTSKQMLGEKNPDTLTIMSNLGSTYSNQGRYEEAEALERHVLKIRKRKLGEHHYETLTSMNNLALTYSRQKSWDLAEELQVQVLDVMKQKYGKLHPQTLVSMYNLAETYQRQKRWDNAETLQLELVNGSRQVFGDEDKETLEALQALTETYRQKGIRRRRERKVLEAEIRRLESLL